MNASTLPGTAHGRRQRGAVAIIFGLTVAVLIGFAGLAIDLGRFFVIKSELQNAMDACALAASTQLRPEQDNPNALTRAVAYGSVFLTGGDAIRNKANFQGDGVLKVADLIIEFSNTLGGVYRTIAGGADYKTAAYVKCTYPLAGLPILFMKVLNPLLNTQTVSAMAVATLAPSSSACAIPVGVCKVKDTDANSSPPFGLTPGMWLTNPDGPKSQYGTGNFGWIDFTPPSGGTPELAALLKGEGWCSAALDMPVSEAGKKVSLTDEWNSRFGSYRSGGPTDAEAPADVTGYSYDASSWPPGENAYSGASGGAAKNYTTASGDYEPLQYSPPPPYTAYTSAQHREGQLSRRVTVAPVVDCTVWNVPPGNAMPKIEGWACVLMLAQTFDPTNPKYGLEYLGLSTDPAGTPCATGGEGGSFGPLVPLLVQ